MMDRAFIWTDRVLVFTASAAFFVMLGVTTISVIGRYLFSAPIPDDVVMNELLIVFLVFLPFSYVQRMDQHVFVTLFTDWLPAKMQLLCKSLGNLVGLMIFTLLTYATYLDFYGAYEIDAYNEGVLELPEWPSRFAVFFGILMMNLRLLYDLLNSLRPIFAGKED